MGTKGRILLHLAAALAGWGIVQWQQRESSATEQPVASGKSSIRKAFDREAGEALLRRLVPALAPAPPAEVVRHQGTLEERLSDPPDLDPFSENANEHSDGVITGYLRGEIRDILFGTGGPDLAYAYFHGRMEAPQVLDTLRKIFPDLAKEKHFAAAVFIELLPVDPVRAVVLLDGLSPEERSSWLAETNLHITGIDTPDLALAILNLDFASAPGSDASYLRKYAEFSSRPFHDGMGDDYTEWLLAQPPSKGRQEMLGNLVGHLDLEDPASAVDLKRRISTR
jgi:hypothetical protein